MLANQFCKVSHVETYSTMFRLNRIRKISVDLQNLTMICISRSDSKLNSVFLFAELETAACGDKNTAAEADTGFPHNLKKIKFHDFSHHFP